MAEHRGRNLYAAISRAGTARQVTGLPIRPILGESRTIGEIPE